MEKAMKHGFIRVAAATPKIRLADCTYNAKQVIKIIDTAEKQDVKLLVFPELCVTGYSSGDLLLQETLLHHAKMQVKEIINFTKDKELLTIIGFPFEYEGRLYNTAAVIQGGKLLGLIPKKALANYGEYYEARYFSPGPKEAIKVEFLGEEVYFGHKLIFECRNLPDFKVGVEIGQDLYMPLSPGTYHCMAGATIIANLSASNELAGRAGYRRNYIKNQSARLICGYIYANAGEGESTTDLVFSGHNLIAENGTLLSQAEPFSNNELIVSEIDLGIIKSERRRKNNYFDDKDISDYIKIPYCFLDGDYQLKPYKLTRKIKPFPFIPESKEELIKQCEEIFEIQAVGLKARLAHIGTKCAVIGVSGGLDSTLALLVVERAFEMLGLDKKGILAVTMPCFGTSSRTYNNALAITKNIGASLLDIPITDAVIQHFKDIGHDLDTHDITFENSQARERTQVLMDLANKHNGIVIGTGDMSELVLGWATYNGDHMSMYGVNSSLPKTLVRALVEWAADVTVNEELSRVLKDIIDTPVSPELLPPSRENKYQVTEESVGPYKLNDFILYYVLKYGFSPEKIYRMAQTAFAKEYSNEEILKWMQMFYKRFFAQQYKRSCLPDGPKVTRVSISPRGDLRMPSDAKSALWLDELMGIS
ncbi:NAD(+) synthase [Herbinix luporum]